MLKRAHLYYRNPCPGAEEAKEFLAEHGVLVMERDIEKKPLSKRELSDILGHQNPRHYLNPIAAAYKKEKLDKNLPSRTDLLKLLSENPELLRVPIITSGRLMTIGGNRQQLIDMFQIKVSDNGSGEEKKQGEGKKKS